MDYTQQIQELKAIQQDLDMLKNRLFKTRREIPLPEEDKAENEILTMLEYLETAQDRIDAGYILREVIHRMELVADPCPTP